MKNFLVALTCFLWTGAVKAEPLWDAGGITTAGKWELAYQAVAIADWMQTRTIAKNPDMFRELNPILGDHPSTAEVDRWFIGTGIAHAVISHMLPAKYARPWQIGTTTLEVIVVVRNHNLGVGFNVKY